MENVSGSDMVGEPGVPACVPLRLSAPPASPTILIGRLRPSVDLWLDSPRRPLLVSRRHAMLTYHADADAWVLEDLKSVNGIFVNGKKVGRAVLSDGDLVTFDERGGRTRTGATKQLSECVCIYRFYKSGYNTRPRGEADQRTTAAAAAAAATTREQAAGSGSADTAPPVAKRPRKDPTADSAKSAPAIAKVPDSQDEDEEEKEEDEEEEELEEDEEEEEEEEEEKEKEKEEKNEEKAKDEEEEEKEEEDEEENETNGADKQKKNGKEEEKETASGTATNGNNAGSSTPTKGAACKCGKTKAEGLMIQCDSCTSWSHAGCVGLSKAKAAQLKSWQCEACRSKGAVPAPSAHVEDDPRQWTLTEGTIISCLPEPASGDRFWLAEVVHDKRKGQRTVQVRWFENDPRKRKLHYVRGAEQRLAVATIICPDVSDLLAKVGPNLYKLQDDPRLYTIT